jgi:mannose/fructose-specific phosphotransferase system component IIA
MSSLVRAIVAGHGDFASGMISAVAQITGRDDVFRALSNRDLSAQAVEGALREQVDRDEIGVIFTDLPAGSCTMAARRLQRERPSLVVVTGTNLATLLDFVFQTDVAEPVAAQHAVEKGRLALAVAGAPLGH